MKSKEIWKIYNRVFSKSTIEVLEKLSAQGHFLELKSPISLGKEAQVFKAETLDKEFVAVKIYRVENKTFDRMYNYLIADYRYIKIPKKPRGLIKFWVEREYKNMFTAWQNQLKVPKPITYKENVIIMEFIGDKEEGREAPLLKDVEEAQWSQVWEEIKEQIRKLAEIGLVHGDLSEYNILFWNNRPWIIDWSQGTVVKSANYFELLSRDLEKIISFFKKKVEDNFEEFKEEILEKARKKLL